jgi:hypothetical protein
MGPEVCPLGATRPIFGSASLSTIGPLSFLRLEALCSVLWFGRQALRWKKTQAAAETEGKCHER